MFICHHGAVEQNYTFDTHFGSELCWFSLEIHNVSKIEWIVEYGVSEHYILSALPCYMLVKAWSEKKLHTYLL